MGGGGYEFNLESVLQLRKTLKDLEVTRLEQEIAKRRALESELNLCRRRIADGEGRIAQERSRRKIDIREVVRETEYVDSLKQEEQRLLAAVAEQEKEIEKRQAILLERTKDQKVMEKLKARDFASFSSKERRKAESAVDELVLIVQQEKISENEG